MDFTYTQCNHSAHLCAVARLGYDLPRHVLDPMGLSTVLKANLQRFIGTFWKSFSSRGLVGNSSESIRRLFFFLFAFAMLPVRGSRDISCTGHAHQAKENKCQRYQPMSMTWMNHLIHKDSQARVTCMCNEHMEKSP